jgi:hypothetical protein
MCFALNTPIESPKGPRPIEDYFVGDPVVAASAAGDGSWSWATYAVEFSSGTGPGRDQPAMVYIHFGEEGVLIVTPDQPLLIGGGMLKRADQLVPGTDSLVAAGGGTVPIEQVSVGSFAGGIHDIATGISSSLEWDGSLDGHLLNAAGVICGDFVLQIRQGDPRMARYLAVGPTVGSVEYGNMQPHLRDEGRIDGELER